MSFSFDRPSLRERTRGKSGDEFVEEMMKNLKQKNRKFFDSYPKWKTGFSFDDGLEREGSAGGSSSNLQSHLADLVARHPELADSFVGFLPEELASKAKENQDNSDIKEPPKTSEIKKPTKTTITQGTQTGGLESDIKLRNTVPDMQSSTQNSTETNCDNDRSQRSQSAPPQTSSNTSAKQKEEGIRLIPIRTDVPQSGQHIPPRPQQHFQQPPSQQFQHNAPPHFQQNPHQQPSPDQRNHEEKGPTVRHIPIFVEGRDEPILPKDAAPTGMKRGGCQGKAESNSGKRGAQPEEKRQQQQQQQQQQHQHQQATEPPPQPQQQQAPPPQPPSKPDPLAQVADILKEVEELSTRVNEWKGNSRSEKEYIYLDEMLTRNLLKLDNIETEGREEVRTARKDVIRRIQAAISILESKSAESTDQSNQIQAAEEEMDSSDKTEEAAQPEPMDVEETKKEPPQESNQTTQSSQT